MIAPIWYLKMIKKNFFFAMRNLARQFLAPGSNLYAGHVLHITLQRFTIRQCGQRPHCGYAIIFPLEFLKTKLTA
jgi:hypothetical protein